MQRITCSLLATTLLFLGTAASSKEDAEAVDPKYTWDLTEIYPTVEAWEHARDKAMQDFEKLEGRRGTLGDSADSLVYGDADDLRCQQESRSRIRLCPDAES